MLNRAINYSLTDYSKMMGDKLRMAAYSTALMRAVKPGAIVADLGAGTGVLSLLACQYGAAKVYAIEPNESILIAQELAALNGFTEKIAFIQDYSTKIDLPEQVDVIVSDMRGMLPLFDHHFTAIIDARKRFLKPGGVMIPQRDTIMMAGLELPATYIANVAPWKDYLPGLNLEPMQRRLTNVMGRGSIRPDEMILPPKAWIVLEYLNLEDTGVTQAISWKAEKAGTLHGLGTWFVANPLEGIRYANGPDHPLSIYGTGFIPLQSPVALEVGDEVTVNIRAELVGDEYDWCWDTQIGGADGKVKISFQQASNM